jgi:hypothetical protein
LSKRTSFSIFVVFQCSQEDWLMRVSECNGDIMPSENYVKLKVMPTPRLHSTKAQEFFCSLCKIQLKSEFHLPTTKPAVVLTDHGPSIEWSKEEQSAMKDAKAAVLSEWDEHLRMVHPHQWEREQKKRARRRAKRVKDEGESL